MWRRMLGCGRQYEHKNNNDKVLCQYMGTLPTKDGGADLWNEGARCRGMWMKCLDGKTIGETTIKHETQHSNTMRKCSCIDRWERWKPTCTCTLQKKKKDLPFIFLSSHWGGKKWERSDAVQSRTRRVPRLRTRNQKASPPSYPITRRKNRQIKDSRRYTDDVVST